MEEPNIGQELQKIPYEPLLPVEKTLIVWSLVLGIALMIVLALLSTWLLPQP